MIADTITSFSCKRGLPEEKMAIGNIGIGNISTLATISKTAQAILDIRAAHEANDRGVLAAYGLAPDTPEPEIVAHLFGLYAKAIKRGACK